MKPIFIVTAHDNYYPNGGKQDWIYVGTSEDVARQVMRDSKRDYCYLIQVTEKGALTLEYY